MNAMLVRRHWRLLIIRLIGKWQARVAMVRQSRLRQHCRWCLLMLLGWVAIVQLHLVLVLPGVVLRHRVLNHNHALIVDDLNAAPHTREDTAAIGECAHVLKAHCEFIVSCGRHRCRCQLKLWRLNEDFIEADYVGACTASIEHRL